MNGISLMAYGKVTLKISNDLPYAMLGPFSRSTESPAVYGFAG